MSVFIKGMEMPKNCLACKLRGDGSDSRYTWDCPFTAFAYTREEGESGRLDECPLVEVPAPHGDLIDRGALNIGEYEREDDDSGTLEISIGGLLSLYHGVIEAPAVIEAEGTE